MVRGLNVSFSGPEIQHLCEDPREWGKFTARVVLGSLGKARTALSEVKMSVLRSAGKDSTPGPGCGARDAAHWSRGSEEGIRRLKGVGTPACTL